MTFTDKTTNQGRDEMDEALTKELDEMALRIPPHVLRRIEHRIHDGIMTRVKEEATRKCDQFLKEFAKCVASKTMSTATECGGARDAMNECFHRENNETTYQKYRIMFLRGELHEMYKAKLQARVEAFKKEIPESIAGLPAGKVAKYGDDMNS